MVARSYTTSWDAITYNAFCDAMLGFLREKVPKNWASWCDDVSDNFRVISPKDFRILR